MRSELGSGPRLLVVADVQTGYHHDSLSRALATLEHMGRGRWTTVLRTDSQLITQQPILGPPGKYEGRPVNAPRLSSFDAVFLLPSGSGTLSPAQKEALMAFVHEEGKGIIVGHAATVGFYDWPAWGALVGARLGGELDGPADVIVEDPGFPGADAFGQPRFTFSEQHPILKAVEPPQDIHVVMRLDPESLPPGHRARRDDDLFPVAWTRRPGRGRLYSVAWGHHPATWDDLRFQQMVAGGIQWAMGERPG